MTSTVPTSQGVSSSASVECATLRALCALSGVDVPPLTLAHLGQRAEHQVAGAPCGLMDQLAVLLGSVGAVLPIVCRPDTVLPAITLPPGVVLVGWPSGVKHDVRGAPYAKVRTAAFMGKRMVERALGRTVRHLAELPPSTLAAAQAVRRLPSRLSGAAYLAEFGGVDDALAVVDPALEYPVGAATRFPIEESFRAATAASLLTYAAAGGGGGAGTTPDALLTQVGELMLQGHVGYTAVGLGSPETDAIVAALVAIGPAGGVYGARISGGGAGGTVVVLATTAALPAIEALARTPALTFTGDPFTPLIQ